MIFIFALLIALGCETDEASWIRLKGNTRKATIHISSAEYKVKGIEIHLDRKCKITWLHKDAKSQSDGKVHIIWFKDSKPFGEYKLAKIECPATPFASKLIMKISKAQMKIDGCVDSKRAENLDCIDTWNERRECEDYDNSND